MKVRSYLLLVALILACSPAYGQITAFSFTSSPDSIFRGQSGFASLATGFRFILNSVPGNGIDLQMQGPNYPDAPWYTLDLAAPHHALLSPGTYTGAERYPFQDATEPGLSFFGNFVGDNRIAGSFTVDEITYGPGNFVRSLAVDFIQYDETNPIAWEEGSLRYNSTVPFPVPEPHPFFLLVTVSFLYAILSLRRRRLSRDLEESGDQGLKIF